MPRNSLKKGDECVYIGPTRNGEVMEHDIIYTLITDIDISGYACVTWVDREGHTRNGKIHAQWEGGKYGKYSKYRDRTLHEHLYRHPGHSVEVSKTGMPGEFILAQCNDCDWEAQW